MDREFLSFFDSLSLSIYMINLYKDDGIEDKHAEHYFLHESDGRVHFFVVEICQNEWHMFLWEERKKTACVYTNNTSFISKSMCEIDNRLNSIECIEEKVQCSSLLFLSYDKKINHQDFEEIRAIYRCWSWCAAKIQAKSWLFKPHFWAVDNKHT